MKKVSIFVLLLLGSISIWVLMSFSGGVDQVRKLALKGSVDHQKKMYTFYMSEGEQHNKPEAFKWATMAAEKSDQGAQLAVGQFYLQGLGGIAIDDTVALTLFEKSAIQGNMEAQRLTGIMYLKGQGKPADYIKSKDYLQRAANQGDERAKSILPTVDSLSSLSKSLGKS